MNGDTALEVESGFAEGEGATYNFTGSQTVVGSSANAFSYELNSNTNIDNYAISKQEGTLTVTNREAKYEITVKANSATATYDGKEHEAVGVETYEFTVEGNSYTVSGLSTEDPKQKDALCLLSYISIFNCKVATFIMLISQNFGHQQPNH